MESGSAVSAVVLAAGMSKRMGSVKQLVGFRDRPLLQIVIDTLKGTRVGEIVVVLGFEEEEIRRGIDFGPARVVMNERFREGMGTSVSLGISKVAAIAQAALIVLSDQPFLKAETIDRLIEKYVEAKPRIAIPTHNGFRGNPVLVDRSLFSELEKLAGDVGARAIFKDHARDILKVAVDDAGILLDVDTASDLEQAGTLHLAAASEGEMLALSDLEGRTLPDLERHLIIVGATSLPKALARLGSLLGYSVTVVDLLANSGGLPGTDRVLRRLDFSLLPKARETYVVAASQGRFDEDAVEQALLMEADYVGLVSSRKKAADLMSNLAGKGVSEEQLSRVRVPAGLDIKANTPEETALSIMAQIVFDRNVNGSDAVTG